MRKEEVPQDTGIAEGLKEVCYAVDENGRYVLVPSAGWEPKNVTNAQAWEIIADQLRDVISRVRGGELSPLAYHMTKNLMDMGLLANYVGMFKWRVKRHMRPSIFRKLKPPMLARYAAVFEITVEELIDVSNMSDEYLGRKKKMK
ncbi:MAG: hypothetical protein KKE17_11730 [Proteobacteria bacterium]|nr:hypothetical protein [Pseudomonadota bacterium]MBU1710665.1 hypothetical protein [Pseudomonadota bacterium]